MAAIPQVVSLLLAGAALTAQATRPAEQILQESKALHFPSMSQGNSKEAVAKFHQQVKRVARRKCELALELYRGHPAHAEVGKQMGDRWTLLINSLGQPEDVLREANAELARDELREDVRRAALAARTHGLIASGADASTCLDAITDWVEVDAGNSAAGHSILDVLRGRDLPPRMASGLLAHVQKLWSDDKWLTPAVRNLQRQLDRIGKPLGLAFEDALGSGAVDSADGTARRTLCVYWSTELPQDAADIAKFTAGNEELRVLGVISFRMPGGIEELRKQLGKASIRWPHCYDAEAIKSPFDSKYRTPRTPFYYLLDEHGKVLRFAYHWSVMKSILVDGTH